MPPDSLNGIAPGLPIHLQVTVTFDSEGTARRLAHSLVSAGLVACAQVSGPIHSTFRWQGEIKSIPEWQCVLKTTADRLESIEQHVTQRYPADTPEITAVPIIAGSPAYLAWIHAATHMRDE